MVRWLTEDEQQTWQAYIRLRQRMDGEISAGLTQDGLSLSDYEILVALAAAPSDRLRAKDLATEVCWDKSRLSKHLARMDRRGLLTRHAADDDGRGIIVSMTDQGRRAIETAAPRHVELVRTRFIDILTPEEAAAVRSISAKVTDPAPAPQTPRSEDDR